MAKLKKKMCKYGKNEWKENEEGVIEQVLHPRFLCKKCLRVAVDKELLCNPKKLED